ncbi:AMP-binding protein [Thermococcus aggregans]|uniref:AMP-binding protein n=1 Tax=Thermococcus aggregans TaxID=110163 RepID=A0A9E7MWT6_THEAG|nr:AMP-binding protein [Thermococcus aggregans]USS40318.1 AMP-binding protein [Thermococcus aggregans]
MNGLILGKTDKEELRYTIETAYNFTALWKERFEELNINDLCPEYFLSNINRIHVTPHDLNDKERVCPEYIKEKKVFHGIMRTSGTTGEPKRIPFTKDDKKRYGRQAWPWVSVYLDNGSTIASFFPQLPSSSGVFAFGALESVDAKIAYHQIPIQYLRMKDALLKEFKSIKPNVLFALTTAAYVLGLTLPEDIKNDIQVIVVGGETLTEELARATLENFPNAIIVDNFGNTEDGITGYRIITKNKVESFSFPESMIILKPDGDDEYKEYHEIYITKIMKEGELTGLPLFNYKIGDLAKVVDGKVMNIIRVKDVVSLSGAKLHIDQVMDIVHRYPFLVDFVIIYHPLSPGNPKPKAIIRVGYIGEKPAGIEDEIRELIYEANNPVRYEVEEAKSSELIVEAVPAEEVRKGLPQKPGKTKRIFIVGKDI